MNNPNDRFRFRVWDKFEGSMDYGGNYYIATFNDVVSLVDWKECRYELKDRFIIQQCTGKEDKNGKLIFEGDIVKTWAGLGCIEWTGDFGIGQYVCVVEHTSWDLVVYGDDLEVVGNIFQPPVSNVEPPPTKESFKPS
jgi:uncharacterized phage protein (TIGR01671 family)